MATRTQRPRTPMQRCQQLCLFLCLILLAPANIRTANGTDSDKTSETDVAMDDDQEFSNSTCSQFTDPNGDVHYKPKNRSMDSLGVIVCHPGFQLSTSVQRRCIIVNNTRLDWSSDQHCVAIENFCPELAAGRFSLVLYTGHRRLGGEAVIVCNHSSVISIPYKRPRCKYDNASQTAVWSDIPNCQAPQTVIPTTVSSTMPTGPQATGTSSLSQSAVAVVICTCLILICVGAFILHLHRDAVLRTMQKIDTQNGAFLIINDTGKKVKSFLDKSLPATVSRRLRKDVDVDAENATAEEQQQQQKQQYEQQQQHVQQQQQSSTARVMRTQATQSHLHRRTYLETGGDSGSDRSARSSPTPAGSLLTPGGISTSGANWVRVFPLFASPQLLAKGTNIKIKITPTTSCREVIELVMDEVRRLTSGSTRAQSLILDINAYCLVSKVEGRDCPLPDDFKPLELADQESRRQMYIRERSAAEQMLQQGQSTSV
eukprot:scpid46425/ scgid27530/ 